MVNDAFPLFDRFPGMRRLPRAVLCELPSPVDHVDGIETGSDLWIKRDDQNAPLCGGNKVRALELLLGGLGPGDTVITAGGAGSTHILSTALHSGRIGVHTVALRWKHDMNPVADVVASRISAMIPEARVSTSAAMTLARARMRAFRHRYRYIPVGGTIPLGVLGHVNAALELAGQIERKELPCPAKIVVPLGSGGTTAGLLLGLAIAGLPIEVVGARVGPRLFVNRPRVLTIAQRTARLISTVSEKRTAPIDPSRLRIVHHVYGGAYGRQLLAASEAAKILHDALGLRLDDTYSAKAWVAALDECKTGKGPVLFWLTFDASCLTN